MLVLTVICGVNELTTTAGTDECGWHKGVWYSLMGKSMSRLSNDQKRECWEHIDAKLRKTLNAYRIIDADVRAILRAVALSFVDGLQSRANMKCDAANLRILSSPLIYAYSHLFSDSVVSVHIHVYVLLYSYRC